MTQNLCVIFFLYSTMVSCRQGSGTVEEPPPRLPRRHFAPSSARDIPGFPEVYSKSVIPGSRIGALELGMSQKQVKSLIGESPFVRTYNEEVKNYKDMGYKSDNELVFFLGFDTSFQFGTQNKKHRIPLYKAFFRNDRLVYIILTTYAGFTVTEKDFSLRTRPAFGVGKPLLDAMGPYHFRKARGYDGEYYFLELGIELTLEDKKVRVIDLFMPLDAATANQYRLMTAGDSNP
ncbi:hypothetical protein KJ865_16990 [Myxococcota bacterium]|nr:hypothetical protein [Myxococcota bacterium]